jgi:type I restriction enzyme S subunit
MAKQLYDYWFVQFDFPDENGRPYKSNGGKMVWNEKLKREMPISWDASNICKIADILSGGTPSKANATYWDNGNLPFFGPTDCNDNIFQIKTTDHITQEGLEHCASSLFEEGVIMITARGSIGKLAIVGIPMAMNQSCYALRSKRAEFEYLYFLTIQLIECLKAKGSGSVFKSIITSDIENSTLCIADPNAITHFCKVVKPIFQEIKDNTKNLVALTKLRDQLLPLLMNGQVSVNYDLAVRAMSPMSPIMSPMSPKTTNVVSLYSSARINNGFLSTKDMKVVVVSKMEIT